MDLREFLMHDANTFPDQKKLKEVAYEIRKKDARVDVDRSADSGRSPDGEQHKDRGRRAISVHSRQQARTGRRMDGRTGCKRCQNTRDPELRREARFLRPVDAGHG